MASQAVSFCISLASIYLTLIFNAELQIDSNFNASGIDVTSRFHTGDFGNMGCFKHPQF